MRKRGNTLVRLFSLFLVTGVFSKCLSADSDKSRPQYRFLRYDEDYGYLADSAKRIELWDQIKYVPLDGAGFLSFGGDVRERFESYENEFFSPNSKADNAYFLQRYLFHADYHPTEWLRFFGQLQSSLEDGRADGPPPGGPRPTDRDRIDLHQFFVDLALKIGATKQLTLRVGRQEMSYGSERLIGAREGPNNRRAFDAVRLLFKQETFRLDAFFSSPVEIDPGPFDDQNLHDLWFWGVYGSAPFHLLSTLRLDIYYLGLSNPHGSYNQRIAREERHTVGLRLSGLLGQWDIDDEAIYQFGRFGTGEISAWLIATDHGYTLADLWGKPRLGLRIGAASGDHSRNNADLQTFNPLFTRGNYFTEAGLLNPQNFIDIAPSLRLKPLPKVTTELGLDVHWRESLGDQIYRPGGSVIFRGNLASARYVGTELYVAAAWQINPHVTLAAHYSYFFAGQFIDQSGGEDAHFVALWTTFRF